LTETATAQTLAESADQGGCRVQLDVFDGPLDLLLSLIKEQQLDIATVPLASVAEQYLAYVRTMRDLDVEVAAEYLVIAATLVFLKSKALLPPIPSEFVDEEADSPEEVEERLRRRLIAYSKYRELGEQLRARQNDAGGFFYRDSGDPTSEVVQRYSIDPARLKRAFIAMLSQARPEKRSIVRERVSLIASMDYITKRMREGGEVLFSSLCHELGMTREVVIVTFLAILELIRRHRIDFEQPDLFDDIRIFPIAHAPAAEEATPAQG
jgi:segregation and condensation protein A